MKLAWRQLCSFAPVLWMGGAAVFACLAGCATPPYRDGSDRETAIQALQREIAFAPQELADFEAGLVARLAVEHSESLARQYRVVRPPWRHNLYVNFGLRQRGLCHHFTADLLGEIRKRHFETLDFRWGIARAGTPREHNSVVVIRRNGDFRSGLVLDPWRGSGRVVWAPVAADRYPWEEADWNPAVD